jgi:hypothetical protein
MLAPDDVHRWREHDLLSTVLHPPAIGPAFFVQTKSYQAVALASRPDISNAPRLRSPISKLQAATRSILSQLTVTGTFMRTYLERPLSWAPTVLATVLVVLVCLKALMAVDTVWDSLSYHLPFSALRAGLLTDLQFQRPEPARSVLQGYYLGFPILADLLRGWMWKLSGWPEAVNLLGIISLLALAGYLRWAFRRIEIAWVLIGILAVPAVQTAAAGNYADLPANAAFTIFLFSIVNLWSNPEKFQSPARWVVMFLAAFAAANMKPQTTVHVCLALPFVLPPAWRLLRERGAGWPTIVGTALLGFCASTLIAINLVKNLILYRNPFFPVDTTIAGIHFEGPLGHDAWQVPGRAFGDLPHPIQWLISILEFHSLDGRDIPYSNGMGNVAMTSPAAYMGGFFSALVVASVCFLIVNVSRRRDRLSNVILAVFIISSIIVSLIPNSFSLRYDTFWMMFLITSCLLLATRPSLEPYLQSYKIVLFASLGFVTSVTGGIYFTPVWDPMQAYVNRSGVEKLLDPVVNSGDIICLEQGPGEWDNRFTIMFAPIFHKKLAQERPYGVREGPCPGYKIIPRGKFY